MPKAPRTPEEIEAFRDAILAQAVELISAEGFGGFSMRRLSARLGIAAKTIYNYYTNKDELYLAILTKGFERLHHACHAAGSAHADPVDRVEAMVLAFLAFGVEEPNAYNLMFTWHVPKYNDYVGTVMEPIAKVELETAMRLADLFLDAIRACAGPGRMIPEAEARFLLVCFLTQLHGYLASYNNTLLHYVHEHPLGLLERMGQRIKDQFIRDLEQCQVQADCQTPQAKAS